MASPDTLVSSDDNADRLRRSETSAMTMLNRTMQKIRPDP
jgi:hypothetical protein